MYPESLELKAVCKTPEVIQYLDLEIRHDRGGFYTVLYDKRDALQAKGKMGVVRRFPHITSKLADACKYGCLVSFLHRAARCDMRTRDFVTHAAQRMLEMYSDGYDARKLTSAMSRFMQHHHRPLFRWRAVRAQIMDKFARLSKDVTPPVFAELFPEGTDMATVRKPAPPPSEKTSHKRER